MAVYTHVSRADAEALLERFDIGEAVDLKGAPQGVENTNYFLTTTRGRYVLTLFERRVAEGDLPFFFGAMAHFAAHGLPTPSPISDAAGGTLQRVASRPAVISTFLDGAPRMSPAPTECARVGEMLARMHLAGASFPHHRPNALGPAGWERLAGLTRPQADRLAPGLSALIGEEIDFARAHPSDGLTRGLVHADLFPDNVFFNGAEISGVIDFYFACTDAFAYDLAIALNAWASVGGAYDDLRAAALLNGYTSVRPLPAAEADALPALLRGAALRFLLTRLYDWLNQVDGAVVAVKDPLEYRGLILRHRSAVSV